VEEAPEFCRRSRLYQNAFICSFQSYFFLASRIALAFGQYVLLVGPLCLRLPVLDDFAAAAHDLESVLVLLVQCSAPRTATLNDLERRGPGLGRDVCGQNKKIFWIGESNPALPRPCSPNWTRLRGGYTSRYTNPDEIR
jgi:hypothetical protein